MNLNILGKLGFKLKVIYLCFISTAAYLSVDLFRFLYQTISESGLFISNDTSLFGKMLMLMEKNYIFTN